MINANNAKEINRTEFDGKLMRRLVEFDGRTPAGEKMYVEIMYCRPDGATWNNSSLPVLWHKNGYTDHVLQSYICLNTDAEEENGMARGIYNPQHTLSEDGKRYEINFQWLLEISEENEIKLLQEVANMANKGIKNY